MGDDTKKSFKERFEEQTVPLDHFQGKRHRPLVHGVFNKESLNLVFASSGGMKSMLMLDLAIALDMGGKFLGHQCEKSRVLYLDAEMGDADIGERLNFFKIDPNTSSISYLKNGDVCFNFMDKAQQDGFIEYVGKSQERIFDVVIFDNLRTMALVDNENDSSSFQVINQFLIRLRDNGITVFLVHHSNKEGQQYSGSSNIITPFDSVIGLLASGFDGRREISVTKNRSSAKGLQDLGGQLISPDPELGRMILNATDFKTKAQIAETLIQGLDDGLYTSMVKLKSAARELGYSASNSNFNAPNVVKFLNDHAEISHSYSTREAILAAFSKAKTPELDQEDLVASV